MQKKVGGTGSLCVFNHLISFTFLYLFNKHTLTLLCASHFAGPGGDLDTHHHLKDPILHLVTLTGKLCICQSGLDSEVTYPLVSGHTQKSNTEKLYLSSLHLMLSLQH